MNPSSPAPSEVATAGVGGLSLFEERAARIVVAGHRARLDWMLRVPEWTELFEAGMSELDFQGRRQGIGFDAALMSLPLEHKFQLVRWTLERFRRHLPRTTGQGLCRAAGVERFSELELDEVISARQWSALRTRLAWRLGREHRRYKHAQQLLFTGFRHLIDQAVGKMVFNNRHRSDCAQEGAIGLLHAIDRVDNSEQDFAAYAVLWIRRSMKNFLMRQRLPVHAPVNLISRASSGRTSATTEESGDAATQDRLCVLLLEYLRNPAVSLDDNEGDDGLPLGEKLSDDRAETPAGSAIQADLRDLVDGALMNLTEKQRTVLRFRYGLADGRARTLAEVARTEGISHQQVSMREKRALERLHVLLQPVAAEIHGFG